jgi:hypothetical protein
LPKIDTGTQKVVANISPSNPLQEVFPEEDKNAGGADEGDRHSVNLSTMISRPGNFPNLRNSQRYFPNLDAPPKDVSGAEDSTAI